jgi:starch-binding outer membrane protein, SusD/RagB family
MKKSIYLLGIISLFGLSSCDLNYEPYESMPEGQVSEIEGSVLSITVGNYSLLKGWAPNWHRMTEYPGDNLLISGPTTDNMLNLYNYNRIPTNARGNEFYLSSYKIIAGCNTALEKLKDSKKDSDLQLSAENLYLRSLVYFNIVNIFGRPYNQGAATNLGVPLKITDDPFENPPRNTVKEVYDQIIADLIKAETLFNDESRAKIFASKEAAQALLARIYLYKGDNQKAIEYSDKLINSGKFTMMTGDQFKKMSVSLPEDNQETIFAIKFLKDVDYDPWYSVGSMYATINDVGWGEVYASRPYLELLRTYPEDVRNYFVRPLVKDESIINATYVSDDLTEVSVPVKQTGVDYTYVENGATKTLNKVSNGAGSYLYYMNVGGKERRVLIDYELDKRGGYSKYFVYKCSGQEDQGHLWSPIVSRLSEMYLIRAEANAKLGNTQAALDDVNIIRKRAGIPTAGLWTTSNLAGKTAFDVVMQERQLELAYEGHRKFDVYRNGLTMNRNYPGIHTITGITSIPATSNLVLEYIPEQQIIITKGVLVQNP